MYLIWSCIDDWTLARMMVMRLYVMCYTYICCYDYVIHVLH